MVAMPGAQSATLLCRVPLGFGGTSSSDVEVEGYTPSSADEEVRGYTNWCSPKFAEALQIPLFAGRDFINEDRIGKLGVMIVNRATAEKYWSKGDPTGKRVRNGGELLMVVGEIENSKMQELMAFS